MDTRSKLLNKFRVALTFEENRERLEITFTVVVLFILFVAFFIPATNNTKVKLAKNEELLQQKEELDSALANYQTISKYYNELKPFEDKILKKVPKNPNPISTLERINTYSVRNNIRFNSSSLMSKEAGIETYNVQITGNFANIRSFFNDLFNDERFFKVSNIDLTSSDNESLLSLRLVISSYYYD